MDVYFNELSISCLSQNEHTAKEAFTNLFLLYSRLRSLGCKDLKISSLIYEWKIEATDYNFLSWINDVSIDEDLRLLAKSQITSQPTFEDMYKNQTESNPAFEYRYKGENCIGLGLACSEVSDTLSIGIAENGLWSDNFYTINVISIDDSNDISEIKGDSLHLCSPELPQEFIDYIIKKSNQYIELPKSGKDIVRNWNFTNLEISKVGKDSIKLYRNGAIQIIPIFRLLKKLDNFCNLWNGVIINKDVFQINISPESETRLSQCEDILITDESGNKIKMNWHARFTPGAGRLYFRQKNKHSKLIIDYVGEKLCKDL